MLTKAERATGTDLRSTTVRSPRDAEGTRPTALQITMAHATASQIERVAASNTTTPAPSAATPTTTPTPSAATLPPPTTTPPPSASTPTTTPAPKIRGHSPASIQVTPDPPSAASAPFTPGIRKILRHTVATKGGRSWVRGGRIRAVQTCADALFASLPVKRMRPPLTSTLTHRLPFLVSMLKRRYVTRRRHLAGTRSTTNNLPSER